jgi:hypothetical protein
MAAAADLLAAVKAGDVAAVEAILAADPELAGAHENGVSAARVALYHRQPAALEALLAAQPPLDGLDHAALGRADDLRGDLAADPGLVSRRSADGFTALHFACFFGGADAVAALLEAGADPDAVAADPPVRPLHSAAAARDADAVRLLLEAGADVDATQPAASRRCTPRRSTTTRRARRCCCATAPTRRCATTRAPTRSRSRGRRRRRRCWRCSGSRSSVPASQENAPVLGVRLDRLVQQIADGRLPPACAPGVT